MLGLLSDLPALTLSKSFLTPLDNAVATARTCYSSRVIYDEEVSKNEAAISLRDKIAKSTYLAGHHTTLQHAHFQFAMTNISRHALWSLFHAHPFYNSEQVSQRYVAVKEGSFCHPDFGSSEANARFKEAVRRQHAAYQELCTLLHPVCEELYFQVYRGRQKARDDKRWQGAIKKRAQEVARYVLPLATHSHLYHTVSGLTLHRYHRLAQSFDCPTEQKIVIQKMVAEVNQRDPEFFRHIEDSMPLEETLEAQAFQRLELAEIDSRNAAHLAASFDQQLNGKSAQLISASEQPEQLIGTAVRQVLYLSADKLTNQAAVDMLLSPAKNNYLGQSLNLLSLSKLSRALDLVHFSFIKKMSHAADSQAQRHRMIPGMRAVFSRTINLENPDYITPQLFKHDLAKEAKALYDRIHEQTWEDARWLYQRGASAESLQYIFTNAYPIRYTDTGTLMDHLHKWTTRLCYNAQEEIWASTIDEVMAVRMKAPIIGQYLLPPCGMRQLSGHTPICPEGDRFCGVPVWKKTIEEYVRVL
jgi:thymidylate synthase ThyX